MRKTALILLSVFIIGFTTLVLAITNPTLGVKQTSVSEEVVPDSLQEHVLALSGTTQYRNYLNLAALNESIDYIDNHLTAWGYEAQLQSYLVQGETYSNVVCSYGDYGDPVLIIGAHYDVCEDQPGADDNASGVAGLLEIARLLRAEQPELDYRIEMVFYTLEEPPFFRTEQMGSAVHAKSLHESGQEVLGMICLEMIGYFNEEKKTQEYPIGLLKLFYPSTADYIAVVGKMGQGGTVRTVKRAMKKTCDVTVKSINAPSWVTGIDFSDHLNYWKYGYKAVMVTNTAFYRNDQYHLPGDTPDRLNYEMMAEVVEGVYNAAVAF